MHHPTALADQFADLVSEKRYEPALAKLFERPSGDWLRFDDLRGTSESPDAVVTWLPGPEEPATYAVVLVYDPDSLRSWTALYNVARLRRAAVGAV